MAININLFSVITTIFTAIFSFKVNLTYPYRRHTKSSHEKKSRSNQMLKLLQFILLLSDSLNHIKPKKLDDYRTYSSTNYDIPFSDKNILNSFSSKPVERIREF